jgi:hypothetical protein
MQTRADAFPLKRLPDELVSKIAHFRVETYRIVSSCFNCGRVLLFRGPLPEHSEATIQFDKYDVLDQGSGFRALCLSCTPHARAAAHWHM